MTTRHPLHLCKFLSAFPILRDAIRTKVPLDCVSASQERGGGREAGLRVALAALAFCVCTPAVLALPNTWSTKAPMPTARPSLAAGVIDGNLYAVGGFLNSTGKRTPAVEVYDPATDTWTTKAPMLTARDAAAAGVINGKLYVAGGLDDTHNVSHLLEVYDPASDTWATAASMPTGLGLCYAAAGVIGGKLYVAGGQSETSGQTAVSTLEVYDPVSDTWTIMASMPTARTTLAGAVAGGKLYAAGGVTSNVMGFSYVSTVEAYDPATDTWTTVASMPTARNQAAAAAIGGKLYVVGGHSAGPIYSTMESYDPATDIWTTETSMPTARSSLAAAAIGGNLYAVGGANASGDLSTLEVFTAGVSLPVSGYEIFPGFHCHMGAQPPATCDAIFEGWTGETPQEGWLPFPGTNKGAWEIAVNYTGRPMFGGSVTVSGGKWIRIDYQSGKIVFGTVLGGTVVWPADVSSSVGCGNGVAKVNTSLIDSAGNASNLVGCLHDLPAGTIIPPKVWGAFEF